MGRPWVWLPHWHCRWAQCSLFEVVLVFSSPSAISGNSGTNKSAFIAGSPQCSLEEDRKWEASEPQDQAPTPQPGFPTELWLLFVVSAPLVGRVWRGVGRGVCHRAGEPAGEEGALSCGQGLPGQHAQGRTLTSGAERCLGPPLVDICSVRLCGDQLPAGCDITNLVPLASGRDSVICHHWPDWCSGNMWSRGLDLAPVAH